MPLASLPPPFIRKLTFLLNGYLRPQTWNRVALDIRPQQSLILLTTGREEPGPGDSGNGRWVYRVTTLADLRFTSELRAWPGLVVLPSPCVECELESAHASFQADIWVVFPLLLPPRLPK